MAVIIDTSDDAKDTETVTDTNTIIEITSEDTAIYSGAADAEETLYVTYTNEFMIYILGRKFCDCLANVIMICPAYHNALCAALSALTGCVGGVVNI